ncbi:hypothetical protein E2C01_076769 [Portunus trituberculatus]|uniref:Uncharacterized protein n=1 Tax=Portunus trituberculatus TaxID=210409 RepID=A0A5B7IPJ6_PORTR|nr:hypothetical protein [Portunus trituberculatus]
MTRHAPPRHWASVQRPEPRWIIITRNGLSPHNTNDDSQSGNEFTQVAVRQLSGRGGRLGSHSIFFSFFSEVKGIFTLRYVFHLKF